MCQLVSSPQDSVASGEMCDSKHVLKYNFELLEYIFFILLTVHRVIDDFWPDFLQDVRGALSLNFESCKATVLAMSIIDSL